ATIVRNPGVDAAPDTYVITTTHIPDPKQRYVLALNPSVFSSVDWTMTFDENGSLIDTFAKVTDQTSAVLVSIGKLAAVVAGLADANKKSESEAAAEIDSVFQKNLASKTPQIWNPASDQLQSFPPNQ